MPMKDSKQFLYRSRQKILKRNISAAFTFLFMIMTCFVFLFLCGCAGVEGSLKKGQFLKAAEICKKKQGKERQLCFHQIAQYKEQRNKFLEAAAYYDSAGDTGGAKNSLRAGLQNAIKKGSYIEAQKYYDGLGTPKEEYCRDLIKTCLKNYASDDAFILAKTCAPSDKELIIEIGDHLVRSYNLPNSFEAYCLAGLDTLTILARYEILEKKLRHSYSYDSFIDKLKKQKVLGDFKCNHDDITRKKAGILLSQGEYVLAANEYRSINQSDYACEALKKGINRSELSESALIGVLDAYKGCQPSSETIALIEEIYKKNKEAKLGQTAKSFLLKKDSVDLRIMLADAGIFGGFQLVDFLLAVDKLKLKYAAPRKNISQSVHELVSAADKRRKGKIELIKHDLNDFRKSLTDRASMGSKWELEEVKKKAKQLLTEKNCDFVILYYLGSIGIEKLSNYNFKFDVYPAVLIYSPHIKEEKSFYKWANVHLYHQHDELDQKMVKSLNEQLTKETPKLIKELEEFLSSKL